MNKKVLVFGGSFNPPHIGHAMALEAAIRFFPCDEIWVMPSADRHDKKIGTSKKHRIAMLKTLLREVFPTARSFVKISALEINRGKKTTTHETLKDLVERYPQTDFWFLVGSDAIRDMKKVWVMGQWMFAHAQFVVLNRMGVPLPKQLPRHTFLIGEGVSTDVSSTYIRSLAKHKHELVPYVSAKVASYIKKHRLYR